MRRYFMQTDWGKCPGVAWLASDEICENEDDLDWLLMMYAIAVSLSVDISFSPKNTKWRFLLLCFFWRFSTCLFIFCMFSFVAVFDNNDRVCTLNALTRHRPFKKTTLLVCFCYVIIYLFKLPQNNKMQPAYYNIVSPEKCSKWRSASISTCQSSLLVTLNLL